MKFRNLKNWTDPEQSEGLVFFAQLLEELLFDYSLDTYKPSAMNSSALCIEAKKLINDIENELIEKTNLNHVLKELVLNLRTDEVAKSLLTISIDLIAKKLEDEAASIIEIATIIQLIFAQIEPLQYKIRTEKLLLEAVANKKEKDRIRALTRNYVTTLINIGYSTRFLYPTARMFFYWTTNKISGPESLKEFINILSVKKQNYVAIFRVSPLFKEIKDSCKELGIEVTEEIKPEIKDFIENKSFKLDEDQAYLIIENISVMDVFSARDAAERRLEQISTLIGLFHHKEIANWQPSALIVNHETKKERLISPSQNPMLLCVDSKKKNAAIKLSSFINNFSLEKDSFKKFDRAAELHSLALRSDSPENQLLNLWVALETIVPSKLGRTKAKINNIIDSILPFLAITYIDVLTEKLVQDFCKWKRSALQSAISEIDGESDRHRLLKLLLLPEHSVNKEKLFIDIRQFYLLRNRAHFFSQELSSTKKIARLLETHTQRVDWQIRRVYRTRNLIVHAGHTPSYISILIKNTHDYLDIVLNTIGQLASDGNMINTIDGAFKYAELKNTEYLSNLRDADQAINAINIENLLLKSRI